MLDLYWMTESQRFDAELRERTQRLRATWAEHGPVTPPAGEYRRRLAGLLLAAAGWLDPRPIEVTRPTWSPPPATCDGRVAFARMRLHRAGRG